VRGTERDGNLCDWYSLLAGAGGETAGWGTERNGIVCDCYWVLVGVSSGTAKRGTGRTLIFGTGTGYCWEQTVRQQ